MINLACVPDHFIRNLIILPLRFVLIDKNTCWILSVFMRSLFMRPMSIYIYIDVCIHTAGSEIKSDPKNFS